MPAIPTTRHLPIATRSFQKLRALGRYYVDKTPYAMQLINDGDRDFLSRPRRFGTRLFSTMLQALFEGRRELFHGLAAYGRWDWSVSRPVLLLDLANVDA